MGGFQTPSASGITRLSQLQIDADKDWNGMAIHNLPDGVANQDPVTMAELIFLTGAVNRLVKEPLRLSPIPSNSSLVSENHSGGGYPVSKTRTVPLPSNSKSLAGYTPIAVGGFVLHQQTPPVDTDETTAANNATVNDMDLLPAVLTAAGDGCLFGLNTIFDAVVTLIGQAGMGTFNITWKYWNGTSFVPVTTLYNDADFKSVGLQRITIVKPLDWATVAIAGLTLYWLKAEADGGSMTQQPLGTQAWIGIF